MIPLIGAPAIADWSFTAAIKCPPSCGATVIWQGKPGHNSVVLCNRCKTAYTILHWPKQNPVTLELDVQIGLRKVEP